MSSDELLIIPDRLRVKLAGGRVEEMLLDDYIRGVVPTEMGLAKPLEALKAQAVTARSYAVVTRRHAREGFDVCATTHCQVWKPENRYPDSDRAVDETSGQVVVLENRMVATHFFGHCDGRTRNSEDVWSGKVVYLRSVPCICGYAKLYGHGVGMCQRGAAAMAREGASALEIVQHYYTGVNIVQATTIPRSGFRESIVTGRVVDGDGQPLGGQRLLLQGPEGPISRGTTQDGRFWFTKLPAGSWDLSVKGKPILYPDLTTDGRNYVVLQVVVPDAPPLAAQTMPLAHPRLLVGTLGYKGVPVTIVGPGEDEQVLLSGSAPLYDPGGFAVDLRAGGSYQIRFLDQSFSVVVGDAGMWARFFPRAAL